MIIFAIIFFPAAIGVLLVQALGAGALRRCRHDLFRVLLGVGLGVGLCSQCYFVGLVWSRGGMVLEWLLLLAFGAMVAMRKSAKCCFCEADLSVMYDGSMTRFLGFSFGTLLFVQLIPFIWVSVHIRRGGWDAWAIWNLRAHFLYRLGGIAWRDAFTEVLNWSHPDYPLLVPAFVARGWSLLGRESSAVPVALACFFTFGSAGLLATSITVLRGTRQGLLAGLALPAAPFFFIQGAMQCADVPVAFFRLATLGAFAMADRFNSRGWAALAGVAAALDAWTKNEGLLWFATFLVARVIVCRFRLLPSFFAGALPVLAPVIYFKAKIASSSDIFGRHDRVEMMLRALDPARFTFLVRELYRHAWDFGPALPGVFIMLAIYLLLVGVRKDKRDRSSIRTSWVALLLTAIGYFLIYLVHPLDLPWLLNTSADRLLLQLWPGVIFTVFMAGHAPQSVNYSFRQPVRQDPHRLVHELNDAGMSVRC